MAAYSDKVKYHLSRDATINDLSSSVDFAIKKGASQKTSQSFVANSKSSSQISFNITPPSEQTVIDRRILFKSTINFNLNVGTAAVPSAFAAGVSALDYGLKDALQAFPLNKLFTTVTASVNNTAVSINLQDVLPALLHMVDREVLSEFHGTTPCYLDNYEAFLECSTGVNADGSSAVSNNPLGTYKEGSYSPMYKPRGSYPINIVSVTRGDGVNDLLAVAGGAAANDYWVIRCSVEVTEPLFISPMLYGDSRYNQAGFLGVNSFNLTFNVDPTMKRFFSTASTANGYSLSLDSVTPFGDPTIIMDFLSLDSTFAVPTQLTLPFMDYPRFITNGAGALAANTSRTQSINSLQLDKIPDKLIVFVRRPMAEASVKTSDSFLPISHVNVTFANASGLLSTYSQQQLWRMSRKNGCKQSWLEWSGKSRKHVTIPAAPYTAALANANSISTCGGILVIDPALDLSLTQPYLTDGSQGQFQLQMSLTFLNHSATQFNPEIVVIAMNSGIISTVAGNSVLYTGLADMQRVMQVLEESKGSASSLVGSGDRMVGGAKSGGMKTKSQLSNFTYRPGM